MGRRTAVPLYKTRHAAFVDAIKDAKNPDKSIASHLAIGTGARNYTIGHTHKSWFVYDNGELYYQIPSSCPCYKEGTTNPCGDCSTYGHTEYEPKTPASKGRRILISNQWTNPVTNEREYFGLRDAVEDYFSLDGPRAPDGVQHGHAMIQSNGISLGTLNTWLRDIGAQSSIKPDLRESRLRETVEIENPEDDDNDRKIKQIKDFGTDENGNGIPDIMAHDMRAAFCTQLMRNEVEREKATNLTGHEDPDTLNRYVDFARQEIAAEEEDMFY